MNSAPTTYVIRVDGHLDDHWSAWLGDVDMARDDDGATTITVSVADQTQLHGVLASLRDIGAVLTELRIIGGPAPSGGRCSSAVADRADGPLWGGVTTSLTGTADQRGST